MDKEFDIEKCKANGNMCQTQDGREVIITDYACGEFYPIKVIIIDPNFRILKPNINYYCSSGIYTKYFVSSEGDELINRIKK